MRPADPWVVENESGISSSADKYILVADVEHLSPQMFGRQDDEAGRTGEVVDGHDSLPFAARIQSANGSAATLSMRRREPDRYMDQAGTEIADSARLIDIPI